MLDFKCLSAFIFLYIEVRILETCTLVHADLDLFLLLCDWNKVNKSPIEIKHAMQPLSTLFNVSDMFYMLAVLFFAFPVSFLQTCTLGHDDLDLVSAVK